MFFSLLLRNKMIMLKDSVCVWGIALCKDSCIENSYYLIWMSFNPSYKSSCIVSGHKSIVLARNDFLKEMKII